MKERMLKIVDQPEPSGPDGTGISRRNFLKILGASTALGAASCANPADQKIFPLVKGEAESVPGVAVWYSSTCTECSAGCGIRVRTREGRAVKIEGNPDSPINKGSLCANGQAALQHLYDPDRIREPLIRRSGRYGDPVFEPISWTEAYSKLQTAISAAKRKRLAITGEVSGALSELFREWAKALKVEHLTFDLLQPVALAKAAELVLGTYGIPTYSLDKADLVVNFGADFLETWVSPCELARGWADGRRSSTPLKLIHIEPRLSLTGANADMWIQSSPGTEIKIGLAVLKILLRSGKGKDLSSDLRDRFQDLLRDVDLDHVAAETGVSKEKILGVAEALNQATSPIVLAGGTVGSGTNSIAMLSVSLFLNLVLGSIGETVNISSVRKPTSDLSKVRRAIDMMNAGEVDLLFVDGSNPTFSIPTELGLKYAIKKVAFVVSFASHLDETSELADLILPSHTSLESWGDVRPVPGVYSLTQPAMTPVFNTRSLGDTLIKVAELSGDKGFAGGATDFLSYLKNSWRKIHSDQNVMSSFESFWLESVEKGGFFSLTRSDSASFKTDRSVFNLKFESIHFDKSGEGKSLVVYPYPSIKGFDGRAANKPWLQELADPITQVVWDAWAEMHPETASSYAIEKGDFVTVRNKFGEITVPVYITKHVHKGIVAVPMGQGHSGYGRYAKVVKNSNVMSLLTGSTDLSVSLLGTSADVLRSFGKAKLAVVQGSDSQLDRELARTKYVEAGAHGHGHNEHDLHHHNHEPKQMYVQREHPLYQWGLMVDLAACTGCSACVVACYAENNIPVVGKQVCYEEREMTWLRIERYYDEGHSEELKVSFLPMMCQHCGNAPCEPVCPVYATYHNEEGLNAMMYNRCVGTRYCSNNCSYKVRRFNWYQLDIPEPLDWQLNPDVSRRVAGVMEKCTFCVQRIVEAKDKAKDLGRAVQDGEVTPACVQTCPTQALTFGNLNDENSRISKLSKDSRAYKVLDHHLNTQPAVTYLEDIRYKI